jgi:hypothetical protein
VSVFELVFKLRLSLRKIDNKQGGRDAKVF